MDNTEIQRIIRDYYEQLYANNVDNLELMDKSLEKYNLPKVNHEKRENMNRQITSTKVLSTIKYLPTNKSPGPDGFTGEFYQIFGEEVRSIFLKFFQKIAEGGTLPNSFYKATITLIPYNCDTAKSPQSCPTPSDPMDCSLPGSSVHGIFQARVLEWGAIAFSTNCDKDITHKKENCRSISLMNTNAKILNKILANNTQQHIKRVIRYDQVGFS